MNERNVYKHITICLGKALMQQSGEADGAGDTDPVYVSIGYFDTLKISSAQTENQDKWLQEVYTQDINMSNNLSKGIFFKTLQCVALEGENNDGFMQQRSPYLFITFVQGRCSAVKSWERDFLDYLKTKISAKDGEKDSVSYAVYRSFALCDMVILWKANRMIPILESIQKVYSASMVGDIHSIPAVLKEAVLQPEFDPPIEQETIPRVTVRYLVRNAYEAYQFFKSSLPDDVSLFTVGIEDITSVHTNMTTDQLRSMLAKRLTNDKYLTKFNKAFIEREIHLGDKLLECENNSAANTDLYEYCKELQDRFQSVRGKLEESKKVDSLDSSWMKAASELYYALSGLSCNILADGFCYLVLSAVALFCAKLDALNAKPSSGQLRKIQSFLRGWDTLMEQVLRSDGKFSQQPGFTPPPLCDVPANLLEFYLAFTYYASVIMQGSGERANRFPLMIVPKLCRRIKVESVFDEDPPCDRLLYVDIPISLLYDPYIVLSYLTHEISHYAGDDWRLRRTRAEKYYEIWTTELAAEFGLFEDDTRRKIKEVITIPTDGEELYLERLSGEMLRQLKIALSDCKTIERWLEAEYGGNGFVGYCDFVQSLGVIKQMEQYLHDYPADPPGLFFYIMKQYHMLFRECYADVAAVYLLELDLDEYLGLASQEIELYKRTYGGRYEQYYLTVERWATVICVSFPEEMDDIRSCIRNKGEKSYASKLDGQFVEDIQECIGYIQGKPVLDEQTKETFERIYNRQDCIKELREYLMACRRRMRDATGTDGRLVNLRAAFRAAFSEDSIFSGPCRKVVYLYRDAARLDRGSRAGEATEQKEA